MDSLLKLSLSQRPKEAAWTKQLIFSHLQDAWWDVEADGWIDWPLLSAQALITTALKYPNSHPLVSLSVLFFLVCLSSVSFFPHDFFHLQRERVDKEKLVVE